uniref:Uncharacterized protein n=1 Tax=Ditylenchus dipsaci TaxID=166011 RepID=A0A915D4S5_9BILA
MQGLELFIEEYESPKRGKGTKFNQLNVYESKDLFNALSSSGLANWKLHESRDLKKSRTDDYMCNYSRLSNYGCQMKLKIRRPHDSEKIIKPVVLNESVKKIVREDNTLSAMQMQDKIQVSQHQTRSAVPLPSVKQLENFKYRNKKVLIVLISDLRQYVDSKSHLPENCNELFVVKFDTRVADETEQFRLVWSTRRLLELQKHSRMLQDDGTYKTNWLGFPVLRLLRLNGKFFATLMALGSSETMWSYKCFLSAISNLGYAPELVMGDAVEETWGYVLRGMCFAHLMPNFDKKLRPKELKKVRMEIEEDVCFLQ